MTHRVILDVDTGTDDAVALLVAALSPDIDLIGATTVNGNCPVDVCTENTLRVFDCIDADIPVYQGMDKPLVRAFERSSASDAIHGMYLDLPPAHTKRRHQHAVDWLIETYLASDGEITLVPVGPLTNIAAAIRKEPAILPKIPELVIMGGGHSVNNVTPAAEFNVWADPEAARVVLNCGRPIRLVTLDATYRALLSVDDCAALRELGTPAAAAAATFTEKRIEGYSRVQPTGQSNAAPVHDALAVCSIIDPSVIETAFVNVDVELTGELTAGRTVCDLYHRTDREPNAHIALDADQSKFVRMLTEILGRQE